MVTLQMIYCSPQLFQPHNIRKILSSTSSQNIYTHQILFGFKLDHMTTLCKAVYLKS